MAVHRSSVYRWKNNETELKATVESGSKYYVNPSAREAHRVRQPQLEQRRLDYVSEMRKNRKLCVTTKCLILMMAKYGPAFTRTRKYTALHLWTARFLKRNHLVIRRVTHKGSKTRGDMQDVADSFANSVNVAVEMDGILSFHSTYDEKYSCLFNMDQTAVFIDNPGKLTVDYRGTRNIDIVQGSAENTGRCSMFLCASITGLKLKPFIVFAGVPGCRVANEVTSPSFGCASVEHTVQVKAWCDHAIMKKWIPKPQGPQNGEHPRGSRDGVYDPWQPMDVSAMRTFRSKIQDLYVQFHTEHPFPTNAAKRRVMLSYLVARAWDLVSAETIIRGFRKAKLIPIGPRDSHDVFRTYLQPLPEISVVNDDSSVEPEQDAQDE